MTRTDMLFGGILVALVTLVGMGFFTFAWLNNPETRAAQRSEALIEASGPDEEPATSTSCGCYQLGFELGSSKASRPGRELDAQAEFSTVRTEEEDRILTAALSYQGNYDLCYQRLAQSGARAFETGYLAGSGRIRSGRFCREGDFD
ncbi:MAG: hypothetical protein AAFR65_10800 [Pseudomonadota bacterium]